MLQYWQPPNLVGINRNRHESGLGSQVWAPFWGLLGLIPTHISRHPKTKISYFSCSFSVPRTVALRDMELLSRETRAVILATPMSSWARPKMALRHCLLSPNESNISIHFTWRCEIMNPDEHIGDNECEYFSPAVLAKLDAMLLRT